MNEWLSETGDSRLKTEDRRLKTGDSRLETRARRLETRAWRLPLSQWKSPLELAFCSSYLLIPWNQISDLHIRCRLLGDPQCRRGKFESEDRYQFEWTWRLPRLIELVGVAWAGQSKRNEADSEGLGGGRIWKSGSTQVQLNSLHSDQYPWFVWRNSDTPTCCERNNWIWLDVSRRENRFFSLYLRAFSSPFTCRVGEGKIAARFPPLEI